MLERMLHPLKKIIGKPFNIIYIHMQPEWEWCPLNSTAPVTQPSSLQGLCRPSELAQKIRCKFHSCAF